MTSSGEDIGDRLARAHASAAPSAEPDATPHLSEEAVNWKWLRNVPPPQVLPTETDPFSESFVRPDIGETAGTILWFWFGNAADDEAALYDRQEMWFKKSFDTDSIIASRFADITARLASGEAWRWAHQGPRDRLAAIVALDQFTRNIFRGLPEAFENDALALALTKDALANDEDKLLKPIERWFLLMPLQHSESASDQKRSVAAFEALAEDAPPTFHGALFGAAEYARRHAAVVRRFGRFPHRNAALGRATTTAEKAFLKQPGARF
jgi:uncharacterized protein (DUF924 family)